jgi:nucleolar protein 14
MAKKGGGSQLSQLKSRLHNDGITDRRQMKASAKKRKRGQAGAEKDEMAERREKLSKIASSSAFNPFEEKVTKPKNAVLGRKIRGATGRPGVAKMGGLKERSERLLPEWQTRNKSGSFVDRRFGENGSNLTVEEKMLERFTKERQNRVGKTSLYNLDDAEEEGLTHYGKSLNDLDDYDDIHLSEEEGECEGFYWLNSRRRGGLGLHCRDDFVPWSTTKFEPDVCRSRLDKDDELL